MSSIVELILHKHVEKQKPEKKNLNSSDSNSKKVCLKPTTACISELGMSKKCWCSCSGSCQARGFPDSWIDLPKFVLWSKHGIWCHDGRSPFIVGIQKSLFSKGFIFPFFPVLRTLANLLHFQGWHIFSCQVTLVRYLFRLDRRALLQGAQMFLPAGLFTGLGHSDLWAVWAILIGSVLGCLVPLRDF